MSPVKLGVPPPPSKNMLRRTGKSKSKKPTKPKRMKWECISCTNTPCLADKFSISLAIKENTIPSGCPLRDPNFQSIRARDILNKVNWAILEVRQEIRETEKILKELRRQEASVLVDRKRQLDNYYEKIVITEVTEKKKARKIEPIVPKVKGIVVKKIE